MAARILIIEDNFANLELLRYMLGAYGYETLHARDGLEGIEAARNYKPDLILCDIQMPGADGYEVARTLKVEAALRPVPIVAVTAFAMVGDREKMLAAGFDGYISKPIDPLSFVPQIEVFLPEARRSAIRSYIEEPEPAVESKSNDGPVILFLDNLQVHLDLAVSIFGHAGYRVLTSRDATEALSLARQVVPDVIVSDVCMPTGSGYDFIRAVRSHPSLADVPFIFVTSTAMTALEREKGLTLGAAKYLFRPIEPEHFLAEVAACVPLR